MVEICKSRVPLPVAFRPSRWEDVVEQDTIKQILSNELASGQVKRVLLFTGGAGTGKTTSARIFANEIESVKSNIIEINCADKTGVEDMRVLIDMCKSKPITGSKKIFILDECFSGNSLVTIREGYKQIKDILPGDEVQHMLGYGKVAHVFKNTIKTANLFFIKVSGKPIITTKDHLFFTSEGWVKACDLKPGDLLYDDKTLFNIKDFKNAEIPELDTNISLKITSTQYELQSRPCLSREKASDRGGWQIPQIERRIIERCKENGMLNELRVESCEIYNRGNNEQLFRSSFTNNELNSEYVTMYDLEVEGHCSYFINDCLVHNCHMLTAQSQNSLLKLLEEPPLHCIFILCTTDPQKILSTILSRAYRYDFQLISHEGIVKRLNYVLNTLKENNDYNIETWSPDALSLIAKQSCGHLRDSLTLLDKILSYNNSITVDTVVQVLGVTGYEIQFKLLNALLAKDDKLVTSTIDEIYKSGKDLKVFIKNFLSFIIDVNKYALLHDFELINIPNTYEPQLRGYNISHRPYLKHLLEVLMKINTEIRWETSPKTLLEGTLLLEVL